MYCNLIINEQHKVSLKCPEIEEMHLSCFVRLESNLTRINYWKRDKQIM